MLVIDLPEALTSYLRNPEITTAVRSLVNGKQKLPVGLTWTDMEGYYEACAAAQQVKASYAIGLHRLWEAVWAEAGNDLRLVSSQEFVECGGASNTADDCWNNETYGRAFHLNAKQWLWVDVEITDYQTGLSVSIDRVRQSALIKEFPKTFKKIETEWVGFSSRSLIDGNDPVPELQNAARIAVEIARRIAPPD